MRALDEIDLDRLGELRAGRELLWLDGRGAGRPGVVCAEVTLGWTLPGDQGRTVQSGVALYLDDEFWGHLHVVDLLHRREPEDPWWGC